MSFTRQECFAFLSRLRGTCISVRTRNSQLIEPLRPKATALLLCDVWDRHWCLSATKQLDLIAEKAASLVELARSRGVLIIHSPSGTVDYYAGTEQRRKMLAIPRVAPPAELEIPDAPGPIGSGDRGCGCPNAANEIIEDVWTRQNARIQIGPADLIGDRGDEVYSALKFHRIETLLVAGVHANMCLLTRSFGLRQMKKWGVRCILLRDLTDVVNDPAKPPFLSHEEAFRGTIEYIETYWAGTASSAELTRALRRCRRV